MMLRRPSPPRILRRRRRPEAGAAATARAAAVGQSRAGPPFSAAAAAAATALPLLFGLLLLSGSARAFIPPASGPPPATTGAGAGAGGGVSHPSITRLHSSTLPRWQTTLRFPSPPPLITPPPPPSSPPPPAARRKNNKQEEQQQPAVASDAEEAGLPLPPMGPATSGHPDQLQARAIASTARYTVRLGCVCMWLVGWMDWGVSMDVCVFGKAPRRDGMISRSHRPEHAFLRHSCWWRAPARERRGCWRPGRRIWCKRARRGRRK